MVEVAHAEAMDEDAHIRSKLVLLNDGAKTQAGVAAI